MVTHAPKVDLFGVRISITDYEDATRRIIEAAKARESYAVSALAVHGLMESVNDPELRDLVNTIDLVTPDGQPVRWALNHFHDAALGDRVYGPDLTWHVLAAAEAERVPVYLYGSTEETGEAFAAAILGKHPAIEIVGVQPDRFREATEDEDLADIAEINESGAGVVLVGRGCPRQERWVAQHRGKVHASMLAVGAAFDFAAGNLATPPSWMQRAGLQWLHRLAQEPGRLWRRYLFTNSQFVWLAVRRAVTGS